MIDGPSHTCDAIVPTYLNHVALERLGAVFSLVSGHVYIVFQSKYTLLRVLR
jgi:hypothetical protein